MESTVFRFTYYSIYQFRVDLVYIEICIVFVKSVFSGQQEVEHVEEHLVIIGCTNNVPASSLFSNSSEVDTRNGWLLKIFGRTCPSSVKQ